MEDRYAVALGGGIAEILRRRVPEGVIFLAGAGLLLLLPALPWRAATLETRPDSPYHRLRNCCAAISSGSHTGAKGGE